MRPVDDFTLRGWEFDERNLHHFVEKAVGLTEAIVREVAILDPVLFLDQRAGDRSGTHWLIGPDLRIRW
ncbi:MAG: hypothetical protein GEU28_03845 [Dehalococcoidia bacterium]|nr:hypothetical protein [Dehalococcoidia bacterium]